MTGLLSVWRFFTSKVGQWIAAAGGALLALLTTYRAGAKNARNKDRADRAEADLDTRERIDNALDDSRRDGKPWADRLRGHRDRR